MTRISCWILCSLILFVSGNDDAKRLYYDLLKRSYNKLIRPVSNSSDKLIVKMGIRLSQLIDIVSSFSFLNLHNNYLCYVCLYRHIYRSSI